MKKKILIIVIVLTFSLSCKNNTSKSISPTAKEYIDEVITILENNSVNRNTIEWEKFKTKIYSKATNAQEIKDTYPSIFFAIKEINDNNYQKYLQKGINKKISFPLELNFQKSVSILQSLSQRS